MIGEIIAAVAGTVSFALLFGVPRQGLFLVRTDRRRRLGCLPCRLSFVDRARLRTGRLPWWLYFSPRHRRGAAGMPGDHIPDLRHLSPGARRRGLLDRLLYRHGRAGTGPAERISGDQGWRLPIVLGIIFVFEIPQGVFRGAGGGNKKSRRAICQMIIPPPAVSFNPICLFLHRNHRIPRFFHGLLESVRINFPVAGHHGLPLVEADSGRGPVDFINRKGHGCSRTGRSACRRCGGLFCRSPDFPALFPPPEAQSPNPRRSRRPRP